jgi:hypothetical protein
MVNPGGFVRAAGTGVDTFRVEGALRAETILPSATGQMNVTVEKSSGIISGFVQATGLEVRQVAVGDVNVSFRQMGDRYGHAAGRWNRSIIPSMVF